jgi:hypothetical protein
MLHRLSIHRIRKVYNRCRLHNAPWDMCIPLLCLLQCFQNGHLQSHSWSETLKLVARSIWLEGITIGIMEWDARVGRASSQASKHGLTQNPEWPTSWAGCWCVTVPIHKGRVFAVALVKLWTKSSTSAPCDGICDPTAASEIAIANVSFVAHLSWPETQIVSVIKGKDFASKEHAQKPVVMHSCKGASSFLCHGQSVLSCKCAILYSYT